MECPFKYLEVFDFDKFEEEAEIRIEQVAGVVELIKRAFQEEKNLFPALGGVLKLLDDLCVFIAQTGGRYNNFEERYDKKRTLAETCKPTRAPSEDQG